MDGHAPFRARNGFLPPLVWLVQTGRGTMKSRINCQPHNPQVLVTALGVMG